MSKSLVEIKNVSFAYRQTKILDGISAEISSGDFVGLLGPNGGGKTTLLKIILGLLSPDQGQVLIDGQPVRVGRYQRVSYIPQKVTQHESRFPITVSEVVGLGLVSRSNAFWPFSLDHKAIKQALAKLNLIDYEDSLITDLSGGQQQRVFIAKAIVRQTDLLILDEPTVGIDHDSQKKFYKLLEKLNQKLGLTILLVSHDTDAVIGVVKKVMCLNKKLVCHTDPQTFFKENYFEKVYGSDYRLVKHGH